ncbi:50S RIBOSOMAL PROTEIN L21, partial [Salix koriyanagi]
MAQRRWLQTVARHTLPLISSKPTSSLKPLPHLLAPISLKSLLSPKPLQQFLYTDLTLFHTRSFSSNSRDDSENEEDDGEEGEEEEEDYDSDNNEAEGDDVTVSDMKREYSAEEKEAEAAAIGYKVIEPLLPSDRFFKNREPVFAVVQVGSHQFKVSNGDCIYVERLKFCEVNDKLILNKVLMLGTSTQTIIGRPILPDAAVHAVVEEHV